MVGGNVDTGGDLAMRLTGYHPRPRVRWRILELVNQTDKSSGLNQANNGGLLVDFDPFPRIQVGLR